MNINNKYFDESIISDNIENPNIQSELIIINIVNSMKKILL